MHICIKYVAGKEYESIPIRSIRERTASGAEAARAAIISTGPEYMKRKHLSAYT
ncbi:MAG TPA: hypothetical protein PLY59_05950 [Clostridiales bacterium]|nr:hypothetical protein [Clostridiales bacterium]HQD31123.1 hypothetical protein [Clostridiales bacterium]